MTFYHFRLLSPAVQLRYALSYGTYLAHRGEEGGVHLYHCGREGSGFFVEVRASGDKPVVLRSFASAGPLEDCATACGCRKNGNKLR